MYIYICSLYNCVVFDYNYWFLSFKGNEIRQAAAKRTSVEAEICDLRQQLEAAIEHDSRIVRNKRVRRSVLKKMNTISELISDATRTIQDSDNSSEEETEDEERFTFVARALSQQQSEKLQNTIAAMPGTSVPSGDSDLVPLADATVFRNILVTRHARQDIESRLNGFQTATREGTDKAVAWARGAFLRALLRALVSDDEFTTSNFSGRKSPRDGNFVKAANPAKVRLLNSFAEKFAGISPAVIELQRAYTRCRETANDRVRTKTIPKT